ncbi:hypothetical protein ACVXG9_09500 [Escherichia coli]
MISCMRARGWRNGAECRTGCDAFAPSLVVEDADIDEGMQRFAHAVAKVVGRKYEASGKRCRMRRECLIRWFSLHYAFESRNLRLSQIP